MRILLPPRALLLAIAVAPVLSGCIAAPLVPIAAQALLQPSRPAGQAVGTASDANAPSQVQDGMTQASQRLSGMLHQIVGNTP